MGTVYTYGGVTANYSGGIQGCHVVDRSLVSPQGLAECQPTSTTNCQLQYTLDLSLGQTYKSAASHHMSL